MNSTLPFDVGQLLAYGAMGVGVIFGILAFLLIKNEQDSDRDPRPGLQRLILWFMIFALALLVAGVGLNFYDKKLDADLRASERPPVTCSPASSFIIDEQNMFPHYIDAANQKKQLSETSQSSLKGLADANVSARPRIGDLVWDFAVQSVIVDGNETVKVVMMEATLKRGQVPIPIVATSNQSTTTWHGLFRADNTDSTLWRPVNCNYGNIGDKDTRGYQVLDERCIYKGRSGERIRSVQLSHYINNEQDRDDVFFVITANEYVNDNALSYFEIAATPDSATVFRSLYFLLRGRGSEYYRVRTANRVRPYWEEGIPRAGRAMELLRNHMSKHFGSNELASSWRRIRRNRTGGATIPVEKVIESAISKTSFIGHGEVSVELPGDSMWKRENGVFILFYAPSSN